MAQPNPKVTETAESAQMHIVKGVVRQSLGQIDRRLPVPYFQRDAMAGYPACYAVLSPDQCR